MPSQTAQVLASAPAYEPTHPASSRFVTLRGLRHHILTWGDLALATPAQPLLVLVHGWMDVGASFQFMVDALRQQSGWAERPIVALDWRGFGHSLSPHTDSYFFADYLGDLDALLDELAPGQQVDLLGHSMGGNVVMLYAGVRSKRLRRLVNLEGFGMPATDAQEAPERYIKWLDEIKTPVQLKDYDGLAGVAKRLQANNPRLREGFASWLAQHWARQEGDRWVINADPAHKRPQPILYRVEEVLAFLRGIQCPTLFVEGAQTLYFMFFNGKFTRDEFIERVKLVPDFRLETIEEAGHMLHHDQPEELAAHIARFLAAASSPAP
jgi:pimeloyl-ACP methyl ester carboxylesterase